MDDPGKRPDTSSLAEANNRLQKRHLEYGASAVFPSGVTPARLKDGRLPHRRTPIESSSSSTLASE